MIMGTTKIHGSWRCDSSKLIDLVDTFAHSEVCKYVGGILYITHLCDLLLLWRLDFHLTFWRNEDESWFFPDSRSPIVSNC